MATYFHKPVLVEEVCAALDVRPGGTYVDGTLGGGGHAEAVLSLSAPDGKLYGCDVDPEAMSAARDRLNRFADRSELREGTYADLPTWAPVRGCDGALLDFGVSSHQLDTPERGFSLRQDGPLDMRFNGKSERTAADFVNEAPVDELERVIKELGEEPSARRIARGIAAARHRSPIRSTGQLAAIVEGVLGRRGGRIHPATRLFQALRLVVNREVEEMQAGLEAVWELLRDGGRLVCIAFHGGEARLIKAFGHRLSRNYEVVGDVDLPEFRRPRNPRLKWVHRHAVRPSRQEVRANPRSRSSLLYAFERLAP